MFKDSKLLEVQTIECDCLCGDVCSYRRDCYDQASKLGEDVSMRCETLNCALTFLRDWEGELKGMYRLLLFEDIIDRDEFDRLSDEAGAKLLNAFRQGFERKEKEYDLNG